MLGINHSPWKFFLQFCVPWTPACSSSFSSCRRWEMPQFWPWSNSCMKGARCAYTTDQGFGNLLLLERHLQVTHSVIRNRHDPEGLSPHPKAGVVPSHWLKRWWWVQMVCPRLVRCTSPSHTSIRCSGPSFRSFLQQHAAVLQTFNTPLH